MSIKFSQEEYMKKVNSIYNSPNIDIIEWNGYTGKMKYFCYLCGKKHEICDARNLLSMTSYCELEKRGCKKFSKELFLKRLEQLHHKQIEIISYNGLSNPLVYKCPTCGEEKTISPARGVLHRFSLCNKCDGVEKNIVRNKIEKIFTNNKHFQLLSYRGVKEKAKIKCLLCGEIFERYPSNIIACSNSCPNCNNGRIKQMIPTDEIQKRLDEGFGKGAYTILDYQGQLKKTSKIKCNNCGLIFNAQLSTFITQTRGCPKCKRSQSKGEALVEKYLKENSIKYEKQKRFKDCNNNLSSFDFAIYDKNGTMYLIEVNGRQHYENVEHWGGLELAQRRDALKANYCKEHNIPLIIITYKELTYEKIDSHLSFLKGSTTISKESRE